MSSTSTEEQHLHEFGPPVQNILQHVAHTEEQSFEEIHKCCEKFVRHYSTNEKCSMLYQTSLFHLSPDGPLMDTENCFILPLYSSIVSV